MRAPSIARSDVVEDMLPFMLCAGVGSDSPILGGVGGLEGKSVGPYGEGLWGVRG
jgi:hypothetical protein